MKCPSCGARLAARAERCPACSAVVAPRLEGALAPAPKQVTPPPPEQPLRDIPGLRKRERTWRDEVRERVRSRRQRRADAGLPLFEQPDVAEASPAARAAEAAPSPESPPVVKQTTEPVVAPETAPISRAGRSQRPESPDAMPELVSAPLSEAELADLPLHPSEAPTVGGAGRSEEPAFGDEVGALSLEEDLDVSGEEGDDNQDEGISLRPPPPTPEPLERPARPAERAQAAALDAGLLTVLWALVLYFAGRAARADMLTLASNWPWLLAYLAFLGLFYAGYFTGTTGQTPGKMMTGLRVVDPSGRPPGYLRAVLRAAAGSLGTLLAGLGLVPMAFDPARRALHDRLLQTRVVHR